MKLYSVKTQWHYSVVIAILYSPILPFNGLFPFSIRRLRMQLCVCDLLVMCAEQKAYLAKRGHRSVRCFCCSLSLLRRRRAQFSRRALNRRSGAFERSSIANLMIFSVRPPILRSLPTEPGRASAAINHIN